MGRMSEKETKGLRDLETEGLDLNIGMDPVPRTRTQYRC